MSTIKNIVFSVMAMLLSMGCESQEELSNPNGIFTAKELDELNALVDTIDASLMESYNMVTPSEAYVLYSKELVANTNPSIAHFRDLGKTLSRLEVFDKIWFTNTYPDNTPYFVLRCNTEYMDYLNGISGHDRFIIDYASSLESSCDLLPDVVATFASDITQLYLKDKNNRLIFTIHYITLFNR